MNNLLLILIVMLHIIVITHFILQKQMYKILPKLLKHTYENKLSNEV